MPKRLRGDVGRVDALLRKVDRFPDSAFDLPTRSQRSLPAQRRLAEKRALSKISKTKTASGFPLTPKEGATLRKGLRKIQKRRSR